MSLEWDVGPKTTACWNSAAKIDLSGFSATCFCPDVKWATSLKTSGSISYSENVKEKMGKGKNAKFYQKI